MATGFYEVAFNNTGFFSGISINLTVASSTQTATSSQSSNLTVVHLVTAGPDTQVTTNSPATITLTIPINASNCTQVNTSSSEGIVYSLELSASNCIQGSISGTGEVQRAFATSGAGCNQDNTSSTNPITVFKSVLGSSCTQINQDGSSSISQILTLGHSNCIQSSVSGTGDVYIPPPGTLQVSNCVQLSTSAQLTSLLVSLTLQASNCVQSSGSLEVPRYSGNNNLRIIYNNLLDDTSVTISSSSSASAVTSVTNLRNNSKSSVWRTGNSNGKAIIVLSFSSREVGGVVIPFSNLTSLASIRIRAFTGTFPTIGGTLVDPIVITTGSSLVIDSDIINACPQSTDSTSKVSEYGYKYSNYPRAWLSSNVTCTSLVVEIQDTSLTYIEIGKLVTGSFISVTYNMAFGSAVTYADNSSIIRADSGTRVPTKANRTKNLSLDLKYLSSADRAIIRNMFQVSGVNKPIFVSLFPQVLKEGTNLDCDLENNYSVYGGLNTVQQILHSTYTMFSTTLEVEEI